MSESGNRLTGNIVFKYKLLIIYFLFIELLCRSNIISSHIACLKLCSCHDEVLDRACDDAWGMISCVICEVDSFVGRSNPWQSTSLRQGDRAFCEEPIQSINTHSFCLSLSLSYAHTHTLILITVMASSLGDLLNDWTYHAKIWKNTPLPHPTYLII